MGAAGVNWVLSLGKGLTCPCRGTLCFSLLLQESYGPPLDLLSIYPTKSVVQLRLQGMKLEPAKATPSSAALFGLSSTAPSCNVFDLSPGLRR